MRKFQIYGSVVKAEQKTTKDGKQYAVITLAVANGKTTSNAEVCLNGDNAAAAAKLPQGASLTVTGRIEARKDGNKTVYTLYGDTVNQYAAVDGGAFPAPAGASFVVTGRLTAAPTLTQGQKPRVNFALAQNSKEAAMYYNMTAWEKEAEYITASTERGPRFNKGDTCLAEGRLTFSDQYGLQFICTDLSWMGSANRGAAAPAAPAAAPATPAEADMQPIDLGDDLPF